MAETTHSREPHLGRKAVNFGKAVARHVMDGGRKVDEDILQRRLDICRSCPSCDTSRMVCREKKCGCKLTLKARWRSETCPQNKWPTSPSVSAANSAVVEKGKSNSETSLS